MDQSSQPFESQPNPSSDFTKLMPVNDFGAPDPFVSPSELIASNSTAAISMQESNLKETTSNSQAPNDNGAEASIDQIYKSIDDAFQSIDLPVDQGHRTPVEVIGHEPRAALASKTTGAAEPVQSQDSSFASLPEPEQEFPPVAWFAGGAETETENKTVSDKAFTVPSGVAALGPVEISVREFADAAAGVVEPIPNAFEVEPDYFDYAELESGAHVRAEVKTEPIEEGQFTGESELTNRVTINAPHEVTTVATSTGDQLFFADSGDIISIDGNDGYDRIDLACFDIQNAAFSEGVIEIKTDEETIFTIHHANVRFAIFAEGIEVDLSADDEA